MREGMQDNAIVSVNHRVSRRIFTALGLAAFGALGAIPVHAGALPGLGSGSGQGLSSSPVSSLCVPAVTGVAAPDTAPGAPAGSTVHYGATGVTVTVTGANFATPQNPTTAACTMDGVTIGGTTVKPGTQGFTVSPTGNSITFTLPPGASGAVRVTETDILGDVGTSNANYDFIQTPAAYALAPNPVEGSTEPIAGAEFTPFLPTARGGVPSATVLGSYGSCDAANQWFEASVQSDSALQLSAPTTYCDGQLVLLFLAPIDNSQAMNCSVAPSAPTYNCIPVAVTAGDVDVYFYMASVNPPPLSTVPVGTTIVIQGSGFGTSGTAAIAGVGAALQWSDTKVTVTVPGGAVSGELILERATGDHQVVGVGDYGIGKPGSSVVPPPTPTPGSTSPGTPSGVVSPETPGFGGTSHPGHVVAPTAPTAHDVLTLVVGRSTAAPGSTVRFGVILTLNGKPVSGAPVVFKLLSAPGPGAAVTPASGTTNAEGVLRGVLRLSTTPGQHLLVAQSGIYSDEVTVLGTAAAPASGGIGLPFGLGPLNAAANGEPVIVWLSVATGVLLLLGVLVNINVVRRFLWSITARPVMKRVRGIRGAH